MPVRNPTGRCGRRTAFLPSPEEIAAACLEIQSEWSPRERRIRAALLHLEHQQGKKRGRNTNTALWRLVPRLEVPRCTLRGMGVTR